MSKADDKNNKEKKQGNNADNKNKEKSIHTGHRARMRERFIISGLEDFADHEVLELLLMYALPQKDVNPLAHELLSYFGSVSNCLDASKEELMQIKGISEYTATFITLIPQLTRRYLLDKWEEKPVFENTFMAAKYLTNLYVNATKEAQYMLCLTAQAGLIHCELIAEGTMDSLQTSTRELIACAMKNKAHSIILAHNHPSGSIIPSYEDYRTTQRLVRGLAFANIPLLDHVVVGNGRFFSMRHNVAGDINGNQLGMSLPSYVHEFPTMFDFLQFMDITDPDMLREYSNLLD